MFLIVFSPGIDRISAADELVERIAIAAGRRFYQRAVGIQSD
jgi:hypothetical protein